MSGSTAFRRVMSLSQSPRCTILVAVVGAACAGPATQGAPATSAKASSSTTEERIARWVRARPGQPLAASIAFRGPQPDTAIVRLLERHGVQPYVAYAWAGSVGMHAQLPPEQANRSVIAEARRLLLERLERNACAVRERVRRQREDQAAVGRPAPDRERAERDMLARLRAEREALTRVRAGAPVVWGVHVTAAPEAVSRLGRDPMAWAFEPVATHMEEGQTIIGVPRPPEPPPVGERPSYPDIARMTPEQVRAQLDALAAEPASSCPAGRSGVRLPGEWVVVARRNGRAVLAAAPAARVAGERSTARADAESESLDVLTHERGGPPQQARAELVPLLLPDMPREQARQLRLARVRLDGRDIYFTPPGAAPLLLPSPANPDLYLFEEANALWAYTAGGDVRRLTAERVGEFDRARLAARQREGVVILYWAASPVWSPDGSTIAYATNRAAIARGEGGQAVWLLEVAAGRERPILQEPRESFRPVGWLGRELLYTGPPGVGAVDPHTGARRHVALGLELAVAADGSAIAIADNVPEATRIRLLSTRGEESVPAAPPGSSYAAQAVFSPDGRRLLLLATSAGGQDRRFFVYDRITTRVSPVRAPDGRFANWPSWVDDDTLLLPTIDAATRAVTSWIVDVSS